MPTNQELMTQLVNAGWTVAQAGAYVTTGVMPPAAGQLAAKPTAVVPYTPPTVPFVAPGIQAYQPPAATVKPGDPPPSGFEWTDLIGPIAAVLGLGTAAVAVPYGISEMIGVQYPWQTGPGEGFIAPWNRNIVRDEQGKWVTPDTRPDLFTVGEGGTAMVPTGTGAAMVGGARIVKQWTADQPGAPVGSGWPFAMDSDGKIHTIKKTGVRVSYFPYKSVVLGKNPSARQLSRAMSKFNQFEKLHNKIQKMARKIKT